jgi:hypothetical protein
MDTYMQTYIAFRCKADSSYVSSLSCLVEPLLLILLRYHILFIIFTVTQTKAALRNAVHVYGAMNTFCIFVYFQNKY